MGVVVLDLPNRETGTLRKPGREVVGMGIAGDHGGLVLVDPPQVVDHLPERVERLPGFEVADVLADEDVPAPGYGDGVLQVRTDRQHRGRFVHRRRLHSHRQGGVSAGAAQDHLASHADPGHRVVHVPGYRAVVGEEEVGDAGQPPDGFPLVRADGFVRQVAAGCDDRKRELGHQHVVQRRTGQHRSQVRVAGGDRRRDPGIAEGMASPSLH